MIIEQVKLYHLRMKLLTPFETSFGRAVDRECILLEASTQGLVGYGECVADRDPGYSYETTGTAWHILQDFLIPGILNQEIRSADDLQGRMSHIRGHKTAKAGVELAFWDLLGKSQRRPLREILGGKVRQVPVGVSVGIQENPDALVRVVDKYLYQGYCRVKIKIKPGRDVSEVQAVRKIFPDIKLQVDANSAYDLDTAEELLPLDNLGLLMIEQPLAEDDLWDHRRLHAKFTTPICLDESIISLRHARQAIEMQACQIVNIKPGRVGGLGQAVSIHDFCRNQGVPVWCGGMLETGVGRAANLALASLPGFTFPGDISATDRYYAEDITQERFVLNADSTITVPTNPGLGISIDHQALEKTTIRTITLS